MQKKTVFGASAAIAFLVACGFTIWKLHLPATAPETSAQRTATPQLPISAAKVPDGWYSHDTYGMDRAITVLSRTEDLPTGTTTGQITVSSTDTSLSPEDFILKQGLVGGSLDSPNAQWSWGIYQGHKTFSMTVAANGSAQWFVYVFGGHTVYEFALSPNDQSNPNLAQDRTDFWKVITYYAQKPSLEKLSRIETQQNCKTITLPEDQEHNIQVDPENGYVVANFIQDGKNKYVFFNYNDDLSQCAAGVSKLLEGVKGSASKLPH
jgi:hypothetical protein